MLSNNILVQAENISVEFNHYTALQNVSLQVQRGEIVTLIGPNGAGKSTLVRVVLGLSNPQQGQVLRQDKICIGYMPQHLNIDPVLPLTVARFINLGKAKKNIQLILEEVGIVKLLNRPLQNISGGEMRRVLLARALLRQPDLLVLDEPIQGVDVAGQYELYELIAQIRNRHGCGILMVSHDLHLVMAATDQVICLNRHICCSGHPETVTKHPAYLELFGARAAQDLAIYTHHHQ
ncbi:MAG: zinc ABC transporter ATP-binding protein ZnuC [Proteobacteria bacterium]|nr:zinc ABC transporter ATP-binding protein ZnuC [Pseudomonadota bacterium]